MKRTTWISGALLLLAPACGAITGNYSPFKGSSSFWLPAPKASEEREWIEATLTSVGTGERKVVTLEPAPEAGELQYVADLEHGFWDVDLVGRDRATGETVSFSAPNVAVTGESTVLEIETW